MKSTRRTTCVAVAVGCLLIACATAAGATVSAKAVTISVASLIPGSSAAAVQQFNQQVAQFEKANPGITVQPVEYQWTAPTFAAKLAAGTLPTVFEVPFTDARTLGENGQLADLTSYVKKLPYYSKYNPAVLAEGTTSNTRSSPCRRAHTRRRSTTTGSCSSRPASTQTSRPRRGAR